MTSSTYTIGCDGEKQNLDFYVKNCAAGKVGIAEKAVCETDMCKDVEKVLLPFSQEQHGGMPMYTTLTTNWACSYKPPPRLQPGWLMASASSSLFGNNHFPCGMCLAVTNQATSGNTITNVMITSKYTGSSDINDLLYQKPVGSGNTGNWKISFKAIDCPMMAGEIGNMEIVFEQQPSHSYMRLYVINARLPTAQIELFNDNLELWKCLGRSSNNIFVADNAVLDGLTAASLQSPLSFRLTSIAGESVHASVLVKLGNVKTNVQYVLFETATSGKTSIFYPCIGNVAFEVNQGAPMPVTTPMTAIENIHMSLYAILPNSQLCPYGRILDRAGCEAAARYFGRNFRQESYSNRPPGCYDSGFNLVFNIYPHGRAHSAARVCATSYKEHIGFCLKSDGSDPSNTRYAGKSSKDECLRRCSKENRVACEFTAGAGQCSYTEGGKGSGNPGTNCFVRKGITTSSCIQNSILILLITFEQFDLFDEVKLLGGQIFILAWYHSPALFPQSSCNFL
jgi:hypothetical protein